MRGVGADRSVVDERSGGGDDAGGASKDGGIDISKVLSSCGSNLRGQLRSNEGLRVEGGSNKGLGVEGGGNEGFGAEGGGSSIIDRGNREARVLNTESSTISDVPDLLELAIGINILITSSHSSVGVADLLLGRVEVSVAIVEVAKLILGVELTTSSVRSRGIGSHRSNRGSYRGSSIGVASVGITSIAEGSGDNLGLLSCQTTGHQGRNCDKKFHV